MGTDLGRHVQRLEKENERLTAWVNDLQAGTYITCVYCGHRYGPDDEVPSTMAQVLKEHIEVCPEHPMSALKAENDRIWKRLELVINRYMTCLEILGQRYGHSFMPAYWNELGDLVKGHLDADSECEQYWNELKDRIDAAYEKVHGRVRIRDASKEDALQEHDSSGSDDSAS